MGALPCSLPAKRTGLFWRNEMRVLWKAVDGKEFFIDTDKEGIKTQDELMEFIDKLRKQHGYNEPTFMHASAEPGFELENTIDANDLPEDLRKQVEETIAESLERPDISKLN